jgi:hypothetical protein
VQLKDNIYTTNKIKKARRAVYFRLPTNRGLPLIDDRRRQDHSNVEFQLGKICVYTTMDVRREANEQAQENKS